MEEEKQNNLGKIVRNLFIKAGVGTILFGSGAYIESKTHIMKEYQMKREVKEYLIDRELDWKSGTDREFYKWEPTLVIYEKEGIVQPELIKVTENDTISAGPIYKDGHVGFTLREKVEKKIEKGYENFKKSVKDLYHNIDSTLRHKSE
jgi:hypothetical protein